MTEGPPAAQQHQGSSSGSWTTLYDVRQEPLPVQSEVRGGVAAAFLGALLLALVWKRRESAPKLFVAVFFLGWIGILAANGIQIARVHREAQARLARGEVTWTEGTVENFVPAPTGGGMETFRVGQQSFLVADGETKQPGLTRTSVRGGPIRKGALVRIASWKKSILAVSEQPER